MELKDIQGDLEIYNELELLESVSDKSTSPTLEHFDKEIEESGGRSFGVDDLLGENNEVDFREVDENKIEEELQESTSKEEMEAFAEMVVEGVDFGFNKLLTVNGYEVKESKKEEKQKKRLSELGAQILIKWGVKFKLEYLFLILFFGWAFGKWSRAKKVEDIDSEKTKKPISTKDKKDKKEEVKEVKKPTGILD